MQAFPEAPPVVGKRWEIIRPLARGGMGAVYVARHRVTGVRAALKLLEGAYHDADYERFQREAHAATSIGHPGIVQVLDADICATTGSPYLAMELLTGQTLRELLDDPASTPTDLITRIRQLLEPLVAAHAKGIVHRDLKPENVFVVDAGVFPVKLLDFGISRSMGTVGVTQAGTGIGTPHYMSPEQAIDARSVTLSSDVWAMGAMLFEAIAGRPPFQGDNSNVIIVQLCTEAPPKLGDLVDDVDPALAELVDRCLAKAPEDRPRDASELLQALDKVLRKDSLPVSRPPPSRSDGANPHSQVRRVSRTSLHARSGGTGSKGAELEGRRRMLTIAAVLGALLVTGSLAAALAPLVGNTSGLTLAGIGGALFGSAVLLVAVVLFLRLSRRDGVAAELERVQSLRAASKPAPTTQRQVKRLQAVLYLDPTTDASRRAAKLLTGLGRRYSDDLDCSVKLIATPGRKRGQRFAEAAEEARSQDGPEGLDRFYEAQLERPVGSNDRAMESRLGELGFNLVSWRHAWRVHRHQEQVEENRADAGDLGVTGLPAFVIGGRVLKGDTPVGVLRDVIDAALVRGSDRTYEMPTAGDDGQGFGRPPIGLQQILVQWSALNGVKLNTARTRAQAHELAQTLLKRTGLPNCNFGQLARRFGDGPVDMGGVCPEDMDPAVRRIALRLDVGEISRELVTTDHGIHILRRVA